MQRRNQEKKRKNRVVEKVKELLKDGRLDEDEGRMKNGSQNGRMKNIRKEDWMIQRLGKGMEG